ncbi:DUF4406 domain-containing protein [Clostridium botulinum]|uniref:DUF4406 domain-containing protein n=1 Tax=unclassified Clostridium TaxID=2614128 RepID=UPI0013CD90E6|nr:MULTISPECIES: DUF4406 domain-containing protein [unclassified Clostridium]NFI80978.1 DUF4406 domain-containing protein [Clostridium botulinum]NFK66125.1 DUF4406 domain-containing protein [Clostridium botulinum]NFK69185.1 DUF4406 domain-containing protein [Clostridium botulinum]NFK97534.1 DUF4406 domain-containing protein [Clostridium botulinum]NFN78669.1 DUF4406 domain-containing protein [Clostridium botulinum]
MKFYIAGKINGLDNYKEKFKKVENKLMAEGHICMNPAILPEGFPYEAYMPICCAMIDQCDSVYMLSNWEDSRGARVEREYALVTNKPVHYEYVKSEVEGNE